MAITRRWRRPLGPHRWACPGLGTPTTRWSSHTPTKNDRMSRTSGSGGEWRQSLRHELQSFNANQQPLVRHQSLFHNKKWKSSSDLKTIEFQGFRDLGSVFDQEELRESLTDVLSCLRGKATKTPTCSGSGSSSLSDNDDANTNTTAIGNDSNTVTAVVPVEGVVPRVMAGSGDGGVKAVAGGREVRGRDEGQLQMWA
uniref:Uncharacterized protein n=1 Tax=Oryza punctata TaxID=4537 RepID=A0A0E0L2E7_ORYPU